MTNSLEKCTICGNDCNNGLPLSNGNVYHEDCYRELHNISTPFDEKIETINKEMFRFQELLNNEKSLGASIIRFFSGNEPKNSRVYFKYQFVK